MSSLGLPLRDTYTDSFAGIRSDKQGQNSMVDQRMVPWRDNRKTKDSSGCIAKEN